MTLVEATDLHPHRLIPIEEFSVCLIDGKTRKEIIALYPSRKNGAYYLDKFDRYLADQHSTNIKDYCTKYGGVSWPKCPGTGKDVGYKTACGKGLIVNLFAVGGSTQETNAKFKEFCDKMKEERKGEGNPMFGKEAWNSGLTVKHPTVAKMVAAMLSAPYTPERREKLRQATLGSARHNTPHSPETVEKLRVITARRWAEGDFNKGATSIHVKVREFLQSLPLLQPFEEEVQEVYYSLDFAFPSAKIAIECDGDYFHINPQFYPDGPKDAIQRRNAGRDKAKNTFLYNRNWIVLRFWECDINAGTFKEKLTCELKRLGLLSL